MLYIVATPIGNLEDLSRRAERILREVDMVVCEDTRVTGKLLGHFGIQKPMLSFHAQSNEKRMREIVDLLRSGKRIALVSDAGTPGVNDPGGKLIWRVVRECGNAIPVIPIPGPAAVTTALSASGFPAEHFTYLGFPPNKKGRNGFFRRVVDIPETVVFLESPYRIMKALASLVEYAPDRKLAVMRELTKLHETIYRGTPAEVTDQLQHDTVKGEFVVVIEPAGRKI